MKKYIILSLIVLILISGCGEQNLTNTQTTQPSEILEQVKLATKEPSEMVLTIGDFPSGWKLLSRGERTKSDIWEEGLNLGWIKGYEIGYAKGENIFDINFVAINQMISIYPIENISKVIKTYSSNDELTYEEVSNPKIGDESVAFKVTDEFGKSGYVIAFNKMNVCVGLSIQGNSVDFELLKDIAKKSEKGIK